MKVLFIYLALQDDYGCFSMNMFFNVVVTANFDSMEVLRSGACW